MKIGIDIRELSMSTAKSGWYQYTYNLASHLLTIDGHNEYRLLSMFARGRGFRGDDKIPKKFVWRVPGRVTAAVCERLSLPVELLLGGLNVFHGPGEFIPRPFRCKSILTIHDLMAFRHPEFIDPEWLGPHTQRILTAANEADAIIAVSQFTKGEIVRLLRIPEARIRVVYNGISPAFRPMGDNEHMEKVRVKYGIRGPYLLFVGNIEPKKNLNTLILACAELWKATSYKYPLAIVGQKDWHFEAVRELVQKLHLEREVIFTGVVDGEDRPSLYSGAELFVFPSLFEGFGIPVIEAMACGTPVVASNRASIPEVADDAAVLVDPLNASRMAEAMYTVLADPSVKTRCIQRGLQRAKTFSWERTARETLKLYQDVA
jgi:glycosyltransferase involved in cell wall biosynthesis